MCIKETLITSVQDIIGEKQRERNEEWYDQECREIIEVKREARLKCIQHSTRANKEDYNRKRIATARVCRRKKRELLKTKVHEIVEHKNESKKYYKRIQEITQEFKPRVNACRDAGGRILIETQHIQRRWKEYFESVLAGNLNDTDCMTFYTVENEDIQPSYDEVTYVIKCLKNHKALEIDQMIAELLKKRGESLWRRVHHLIKLIRTQHKMLEE